LQKQTQTQTERRREDEMRNEEKMNHGGGVAGFYTTILPTALPKEIRIIFSWWWH